MSNTLWKCCALVAIVRLGSVAVGGDRLPSDSAADVCTCRHEGRWAIAESRNFSVWTPTHSRQVNAVRIAETCECVRSRILQRWALLEQHGEWEAKCIVVVHDDRAAYIEALGLAHQYSVGCTTITVDRERIIYRRVDLRSDVDQWEVNGLPHELTHVVIADVVRGRSIPVWLHEGLAMMSESEALQQSRLQLLSVAAQSEQIPDISKLFGSHHAGNRTHTDLDYAVSLSLVRHLEQLGDADELMQFTSRTSEMEPADAFFETYGLSGGLAQMEVSWRDSITDPDAIPYVDVDEDAGLAD